ncbi:MAG: DUF1553 domain-containing protein [Chloracidobacterium sp.]|nr:DUF1553 domain-containing protein [Chloracidobacterium sp.]
MDWRKTIRSHEPGASSLLHRLIMTSQAYQLASDDIAANVALDPENRLIWRMPLCGWKPNNTRPDTGSSRRRNTREWRHCCERRILWGSSRSPTISVRRRALVTI